MESTRSSSDGRNERSAVTLLAVGRAVDKKGFDDLLRALASIPGELHWQLLHVGDGPQLPMLKALAHELRIDDRIRWLGPQAHAVVLGAYRTAEVFVLPSRIASDGDRDGLPNVLLEAQSQRLACVSTRVSGIPELIVDGETGLLVPAGDLDALQRALTDLLADPERARRLGEAGRARVRASFSATAASERILKIYEAGRYPHRP